MAEISAEVVKELRELTGAGMMDCKKVLVETQGNLDAAVQLLREKGLGKANKKADRLASEGLVGVNITKDFKTATISEINSETDFVAKNEIFINLTNKITLHIESTSVKTVECLNSGKIDGIDFVDFLNTQISVIGENIVVRRFETIKAGTNGVVNGYVHQNGRVGVLLGAICDSEETAKKSAEFLRNIAMHAAAMKPTCISYKELDSAFVENETVALRANIEKENEEARRLGKHEKRIPDFGSRSQITDLILKNVKANMEVELKASGKPEKIWDKIIPGQIDRFIADNSQVDQQYALLSQNFVMDDSKTIEQAIEAKAQELGGKIELVDYVRFELGEGLDKKVDDFAAEVAAQLK